MERGPRARAADGRGARARRALRLRASTGARSTARSAPIRRSRSSTSSSTCKHADPNDTLLRHRFLPHKAIRICVSPEVAEAIEATGHGAGAGVHDPGRGRRRRARAPRRPAPRATWTCVVAANKQPEMGARSRRGCAGAGRAVQLLDTAHPARPSCSTWLARARVAVFVPNPKEGFYLPAIEAMALGTLVVCPDCVGNRSFCEPGVNCFRPPYEVGAIVAQAEQALACRETRATGRAAHATARASRPRRRASGLPGDPRPARRALGRLMATVVVAGAIANKLATAARPGCGSAGSRGSSASAAASSSWSRSSAESCVGDRRARRRRSPQSRQPPLLRRR